MINVGTIPEDFSFTDVYTFHVDALPSLLVARRASADELIWDADGGFTDQWRDRSSYEGSPEAGYDFHVARRSFSVAGLPIFAAGTAGGGGGGGGEPTGPAGGDLAGTYPNPTLSAAKTAAILASAAAAAAAAAAAYTDAAIAGIPVDDTTLDGVTADLDGAADGQLLGFVGGEIVPVDPGGSSEGSDSWRTALDIDFAVLSAQTLVDGPNTVDGKTWTGVNIASRAGLFSVVPGSGLEVKTNATLSDMSGTVRSLPHIRIDLAALLPPEASLASELRLWVAADVQGSSSNVEVSMAGLMGTTFTSGQEQFVRVVNGAISGQVRFYDALINSATTYENAVVSEPDADVIQVIHLKNPVAGQGVWLKAASTLAPSVAWPAARDLTLVGAFNLSYIQPTAKLAQTRWLSLAGVSLFLGAENANTNNNTSFKALFRRVRLDYKL